jgi:CRISPR-associated endonuclease/helicase Cas3
MSVPRLGPDDFARYFEAVHSPRVGGKVVAAVQPFPWQERLARQVFERGWPGALDVPTGAGKTAAIDVAIFHLALEATRGVERKAPMRIAFVVDRRLVVDEAHRRARQIADALASATDGVLVRVRERLQLLAGPDSPPLRVARLRGGIPQETDWARTPCQPTVLVSTVDQVGSRVLFRGYGVSAGMSPVHAGLLGMDALYLLDEAHLSQPFVHSLRDARAYQDEGLWSEDAARAPFAVATLSATQSDEAPRLVKTDDLRHPTLGPRLKAHKEVELVRTGAVPGDPDWVQALATRVHGLSALGGGAAVTTAVVVNRVESARRIFAAMKRLLGGEPGADHLALLIGPSRPLERDERLRSVLPRVEANRSAAAESQPLIVVATQCIEAGADFDFDAMVSEVAPLDCLRQRFGRLNRTGRLETALGVVIASDEQVRARAEPDPVYGGSLTATWGLLTKNAEVRGKGKSKSAWIDFGISSADAWLPKEKEELESYLAPRPDAPVMMPAFVRQWSCTSPVPVADPDIALFLHGPATRSADVQLIWRSDLQEGEADLWVDHVAACPPSPLESISLPLYAVRAWLHKQPAPSIADVELDAGTEPTGPVRKARLVLRWRGPDDVETQVVKPSELKPGDVVVVPAEYGGCDQWGWAQASDDRVSDWGTQANQLGRRLDICRLSHSIVAEAWEKTGVAPAEARTHAARLLSALAELSDASDREVKRVLAASEHLPPGWERALEDSRVRRYAFNEARRGRPLALLRTVSGSRPPELASTEGEAGMRSSRPTLLAPHSGGVRKTAEEFAERAGLSPELVQCVGLAALLHDSGKAHPDMKTFLYGGDELAALTGEDLAKSGRWLGDRERQRSGLPRGARHELASLQVAEADSRLLGLEQRERELVLWLIGTHHGHGRPFFPPVPWPPAGSSFIATLPDGDASSAPAPTLAARTAEWCERQLRLSRAYGPWGLARLEAILRLADHRQSEREESSC